MKLKATDTLHVSSVQADNLAPGDQFEVDDATGKLLVERGLATEVKAKVEHETKMEAPPANKAKPAAKRKAK